MRPDVRPQARKTGGVFAAWSQTFNATDMSAMYPRMQTTTQYRRLSQPFLHGSGCRMFCQSRRSHSFGMAGEGNRRNESRENKETGRFYPAPAITIHRKRGAGSRKRWIRYGKDPLDGFIRRHPSRQSDEKSAARTKCDHISLEVMKYPCAHLRRGVAQQESKPTSGKVPLRRDVIERGGLSEAWYGGGAGS